MAVKTQCPRCKQPLSVPSKLAGSYANCPRCQGRFWISKDAPIDSSISDSVGLTGSALTLTQAPAVQSAPVATPPSAGPASPPRPYFPSVTPLASVATPRAANGNPEPAAANPPAPPPQARKVARLVSADAAESNLKIAPDGQLPNLQLQDVDKKDKGQGKSRSIPPLVLLAAWGFSVAMTIAIVMFSGNNGDSEALTQKKTKAMKEIEEQYFGDPSHGGLLPYQRLLREAQQARAREDFKAEKQCYRQVLDMLRTESRGNAQSSAKHLEKGVTGSREHDRELEKLIITVLGDQGEMESDSRYEILNTIARGDFATVSRARDRELGREVAVKQIHAQYLADPRQLARYWQEAQLLASLQHPNILTIYDVVRPRGWLILELMRSSLKPAAEGEPMDLDQLRAVLTNCLNGLAFLHSNRVIHGDIKPSNILVGTQNRVKLGDFGLARRASNEEGSLLKGTTKYMAPELLSAQFGAVGPASDLYSLGFTAYELMTGKHFASLLPTLATFGRNQQVAWMMWHSTPDVKLPEIQRVLEGVPDDLAHVIQRLIAKDQSQRYATATEALQDLHSGRPLADGLIDAAVAEAEAHAAAAARKKKRIRTLALLSSGLLAVLLALAGFQFLKPKPKPTPVHAVEQLDGTISDVYPASHELGVSPSGGAAVKRIIVKDQDIIYVNGQRHLLEELERGDIVKISKSIDPISLKDVREIHATRPGRFASGKLLAKDDQARTLDMSNGDNPNSEQLKIFVPADAPVSLNGARTFQGKPVTLAMLVFGDRLKAHYDLQESSNKAIKVEALRQVELQGTLATDFDARTRLLSVVNNQQQVIKLPFGSQYIITVNGRPEAEPTALKRGDRVAIKHDSYIAEVVAQRTLGAEGVVAQIRFEPPRSLSVTGDGGQKTYLVGPECKISLGGESVPFDALHAGDRVTIEHGAIDAKNQSAISAALISAERPADPGRWALLIAVQDYDDTKLSKLGYPLADAAAVADSLTKRYRVPAEQLQVFRDPSDVTLEREVPEFIKRVPADGRLIVYFAGHAMKDAKGQTYLAPKDFRSDKPDVNGRALQWLVDLMEDCPAKEKLLLLDASHAGAGAEQASEPSSAEMIASLKRQPNRALLRTVTAVASCRQGERGSELAERQHGLFAACLTEGYGGAADANRDTRIEPTELFAYLQKEMASHSQGKQTPALFLPDDRPPRLTEAAKTAVRRMADRAAQAKIDLDALEQEYNEAVQAAGSEPEPRLIYGLLLMKRKDGEGREKAMQHFQVVKSQMPDRILPYAALAWLRMDKRTYAAAINELTTMIGKIPKQSTAGTSYSAEANFLFRWSGQLREHAAGVSEASLPLREALAGLDAAIAAHGPQAMELYAQGRQATAGVLADFDARMADSKDETEVSKLKVDRKQLSKYADFPLDKYIRQVLLMLDQ